MNIIGLFAAVHVTDIARAEAFYTKLIGRAPDHKPMPFLTQWVGLGGAAGVQLFLEPAKAGHGLMTIVTPDVEAAGKLFAQAGLTLGEIQRGPFGAVAHIDDPDGNRVFLTEPPKQA